MNNIVSFWVQWYFFEVPREILQGWKNFLSFGLNFFSIPLLLKTLFSHWKRYYWVRGRGFDIGEYFSVLFSNIISRFLGALMRIVVIIIGLVFEIFIAIFGLIIFLGWIFLPILLIFGMLIGFSLLV